MKTDEAGGKDLAEFGQAYGRGEAVKPRAYWAFHEGRGQRARQERQT